MKISRWVERFLDQPAKTRRTVKLGSTGLPKKDHRTYRSRCDWDHDQILAYLKANYITSSRKLHRKAIEHELSPSMRLIRKRFGSWSLCKREAFGNPTSFIQMRDEKEFISTLVKFKIVTYRQFLGFKRRNPDLLPGYYYVLVRFGSWSNVKRIVSGCMVESILERYILLKIRLSHLPTTAECKEAGVEIDVLLDFVAKDDLIMLISKMEPYYAAKIGNPIQTLESVH